MRTPIIRRRAAKSFDAALRLVFSELDASMDRFDAVALKRTPDVLSAHVLEGISAEGESLKSVQLAQEIVRRLKAVDLMLFASGAPLRHRDMLLSSVSNHIRQSATVTEILRFRDQVAMAAKKQYVRSPDWPDYLRALALILNIIADIWEFWKHYL